MVCCVETQNTTGFCLLPSLHLIEGENLLSITWVDAFVITEDRLQCFRQSVPAQLIEEKNPKPNRQTKNKTKQTAAMK
eukprot:m.70466 g.70466  ORF g.70466 m.70466 type:complete len:78 (+) comp11667_c0_seq1:1404-1637(+)